MSRWVRLLRQACVAAAVLAALAWVAPRYGVIFVGGWSMAPAYVPGDLVVYTRRPDFVTERNVVLRTSAGAPRGVLHRVVAVLVDGTIRTKGDANATADIESVTSEQIAGVALGALPTGRAVHALAAGARWCYNHVPIANMRL